MVDREPSEPSGNNSPENLLWLVADIARQKAKVSLDIDQWMIKEAPGGGESSFASRYLYFELSDDFESVRNGMGTLLRVYLPLRDMTSSPKPEDITYDPWFVAGVRLRSAPTEEDPQRILRDEELIVVNRHKIEVLHQVGEPVLGGDITAEDSDDVITQAYLEGGNLVGQNGEIIDQSRMRLIELMVKIGFYQVIPIFRPKP